MLAWGWRIPFLLSVCWSRLGLYIRGEVSETPVFQEVRATAQAAESSRCSMPSAASAKFSGGDGRAAGGKRTGLSLSGFRLELRGATRCTCRKAKRCSGVILPAVRSRCSRSRCSRRFRIGMGRRPVYMCGCAVLGGLGFSVFRPVRDQGAVADLARLRRGERHRRVGHVRAPGGLLFGAVRTAGAVRRFRLRARAWLDPGGGPGAVSGNVAARRGWRQTLVGRRLHHRAFADHGSGDHHRTGDAPWRHCRRTSRRHRAVCSG